MSPKIKFFTRIVAIAIVLIGELWFYNAQAYPWTEEKVTVKTDKTRYEPCELIEITVFNGFSQEILLQESRYPPYGDFIRLSKEVRGGWIKTFEFADKLEPILLKPGEKHVYFWNQKIEGGSSNRGRYRVTLTYYLPNVGGDLPSNEFTIQPKLEKEITISTDKTEYKKGEMVKVTIRNNTTDIFFKTAGWEPSEKTPFHPEDENSPFGYLGWGFIEKFHGEDWVKIEPLWWCGRNVKLKIGMCFWVLKCQESRTFEWNQTMYDFINTKTDFLRGRERRTAERSPSRI